MSDAAVTPSFSSSILSAIDARLGSWVTISTDMPSSLHSCLNRSIMPSPLFTSRFPVGSSASRSGREPAIALAMAALCLWPPDSWSGMNSILSERPTFSRASFACSSACFVGTPESSNEKMTLSKVLSLSIRWKSWNIHPTPLLLTSTTLLGDLVP